MFEANGRRIMRLSVMELLNWLYAHLLKGLDAKGRRRVNMALLGRLGEHGGEIVDDPDLPASMQGLEAPAWFTMDHDPFATTVDTSRAGGQRLGGG